MSTAREASPPLGALASVVIAFERGGNSDVFVGQGWSASEPTHRWAVGERSLLILPPLAPHRRFALILDCAPLMLAGVRQNLSLELNGVSLGVALPRSDAPFLVAVPGEIVNSAGDNTLVCLTPGARVPAEHVADSRERRALSVAWRRLELAPDDAGMFERPQWLPDVADIDLPPSSFAGLYQSLGQNCELGIFQRRCGSEPIGLLRFASIFPRQLVDGLRTRFAGVDAVEELALAAVESGGELIGNHARYGLSYHTFKYENEIDAAEFKIREARRLGYLARLFIEQIEGDEKVFVRRGDFESDGEMLALHRLLRGFNAQARLLMVQPAPPSAPECIGRVQQLAPNLYRGFLSRFADVAYVPRTLVFEDWARICATLYVDQRSKGRADPPA